ncbi:Glycosyl transferase family 2 [Trichococcus ilyis]|uniref:Glycosyl transferase family 2 n=2 Tax=Trichococcus ilyis TaxID=640938 RepID=A0A143YMB1_9LACT|nr:nucleotide-diphospho-sugar transferases [Trichococcus ilyis]SEJ01066.1 Glycosyl transferase family 2 [Trichococcus ilyis]
MKPMVSIIVPVYNAAPYLKQCIDSLTGQTLKETEIILINDGSTDDSLTVCVHLASTDDRIRVIDKPNGGVSEARNDGLRAATGEYVGFVDPDDWVDIDMYERMLATLTAAQAEVCMCNYVKETKDGTEPVLMKQRGVIEKAAILDAIVANVIAKPSFRSGETDIMGSVCRLLIKRELLEKENIWFDKEVAFMEDLLVCVEAFLKCDRIAIDEGAYYHYRVHESSTVMAYKAQFHQRQKQAFANLQQLLVREGKAAALAPRMANRYIIIALLSLANEAHTDNPATFREKIRNIGTIVADKELAAVLGTIDLDAVEPRKKLELNLIKKQASVTLYLYYSVFNKIKAILGKG